MRMDTRLPQRGYSVVEPSAALLDESWNFPASRYAIAGIGGSETPSSAAFLISSLI